MSVERGQSGYDIRLSDLAVAQPLPIQEVNLIPPVFWNSDHFDEFGRQIGVDSREIACLRGVYAHLSKLTDKELHDYQASLSIPIKSGHVIFRPFTTKQHLFNLVSFRKDPLTDRRYGIYNLGLVGIDKSQEMLTRLGTTIKGFTIVTYDSGALPWNYYQAQKDSDEEG